jgi:hypothetical protein
MPRTDAERQADTRVRRAQRKRQVKRKEEGREREWSRDAFLGDLYRISRRATAEIESEPEQAQALDRAREQAREGNLVSQEELERRLNSDDE